ncbi:cyclopropane-fatty-acyl-phospholipid synthase family protein [Acidisphaera sp. L21]|uniref:SAM-dependent methyltransferase n=1 Tax=Acidisphaera sp. L21 TaxID=1641851 RepID=UPI00131A6BF3|nr:cyclopropane-fatty-acyl-phospholipid synthase family protein [Acidisphaera sp. L21]
MSEASIGTARMQGLSANWLVKRLMRRLVVGSLVVHPPGGGQIAHYADRAGPDAVLVLHRWRAVRRLMLEGDIGFAESYMDGDWSSPDLTALIQLAAHNMSALGATIDGPGIVRGLNRVLHRLRPNSKAGAKRNIEAHYDLGNAFYAAWLDRSMTYSSALFSDADQSLEQAQRAKQDRVIDLLRLSGGETVLEIGCGWGGLAGRLARDAEAHVTGITLSPSQLGHAKATLQDTDVDLRLQDYRDTTETFDRIVSIEMLEAVGAEYWPVYFERLRACLRPGGVAVLQVITIAEDRYEIYRRSADFIQRYVFPGGMLPSVSVLSGEIARAGLRLSSAEHFGHSYARTLREWRDRFHQAWPQLAGPRGASVQIGGRMPDERFRRRWDYYLSYCEAGFLAGAIDVGLFQITHADAPA